MELKRVLDKRHSCRSFKKSKKAKLRDVFQIIESAMKAPMAGNLFTIRMILVDDEDKKHEIAAATPNEFLEDASHLIVVCSDLKQVVRAYGKKGEEYASQQAGAVIENMLLRAEDLGLASCWGGAFNENRVKRVLAIPADFRVEAIIPVGIEHVKEPKKSRPTIKSILSYNKFGKKNW